MKLRESLRAFAAVGLTLGAIAAGAGSASAAAKDGWLNKGELGLFCYEDRVNSVLDLYDYDEDFSNDYFKGSQSCAGHSTNDWTESFSNNDSYSWDVYTDWRGYGYKRWIDVAEFGNFDATHRNKSSSAFPRVV
ncbi:MULTISPECIES: hypothetical protein [unclassified Streptomyces]|uniref:hypothetical protein n=1 Tax=unclassified Streptomyces TaxID=2593676 RepID=UPI00369527C4